MEHYYFLIKGNTKQGPYKLTELKLQTIYFDELIWRSDSEEWKKATDFEELKGIIIVKPPLTPLEQKKEKFDSQFFSKSVPNLVIIYFIATALLSIFSFSIASSDWAEIKSRYLVNKEDVGKDANQLETQKTNRDLERLKLLQIELNNLKPYVNPTRIPPNILQYNKGAEPDSIYKYERIESQIRDLELFISFQKNRIKFQQTGKLSNKVEPIYNIPQNIMLTEDLYAQGQSFLFRPFNAFFTKVYLSREEQENSDKLFLNLTLSSCLSMLLIFIILTCIYYLIQKQNIVNSNK